MIASMAVTKVKNTRLLLYTETFYDGKNDFFGIIDKNENRINQTENGNEGVL